MPTGNGKNNGGPPLQPKARAFCREFARDHNATQAAIRAGYAVKKAKTQGHRLLSDPRVKALLVDMEAERDETLEEENIRIKAAFWAIATEARAAGARVAALRALESLAKINGLFVERRRLETDRPLEIDIVWGPAFALDR